MAWEGRINNPFWAGRSRCLPPWGCGPPSARHWLGTDDLGRDLFQRLLDGGRVSLLVGLSGALLSAVIGAFVGVVAGYLGGRLDAVLMRLTDGVIALPLLREGSMDLAIGQPAPGMTTQEFRIEPLLRYDTGIMVRRRKNPPAPHSG